MFVHSGDFNVAFRAVLNSVSVLALLLGGLAAFAGSFALTGMGFSALICFNIIEKELVTALGPRSPVCYAVKNLEEGKIIRAEDVAERQLTEEKIPMDAVRSKKKVIGCRVKYGVSTGMIISLHDLDQRQQISSKKRLSDKL